MCGGGGAWERPCRADAPLPLQQHGVQLSQMVAPAILAQPPGSHLNLGEVFSSEVYFQEPVRKPQLLPASSTHHRADQPAQRE